MSLFSVLSSIRPVGKDCLPLVMPAAALLLSAGSPQANAQTAYHGAVNLVSTSGLYNPASVAVDAHGNVFVAASSNVVEEIVAVNGQVSSSSTVITVGSGFSHPHSVAVDSSGNVFVADYSNNAVKEIVASTGGNAPGVVSSTSTVITVGSGFSGPNGVAVDGSGNVFVADGNNNLVKEIVAGTGGNAPGVVSSISTVTTLASSFSFPLPCGVAVDGSGNVFVADGGYQVEEIVAGTGGNAPGVVSSISTVITVGSGFYSPSGVAVDAGGNIFVADTNNDAVKEIMLGVTNFGPVNVGSATTTVLIPFTFTAPGTPSGWSVLTQGATGKDFTEVTGSTTCSTSTPYNSGDTCSVAIQFSPKYPGVRMGAVQLKDASGNVIATAPLRGVGSGPQIVFPSNSTPSAVGSGVSTPHAVAVDGSGNVFVVDEGSHTVKEIVAVNGQVSSSSTVQTVGNGFSIPFGVAVDGSGNVFVADQISTAVKEIVAVNGQVSSSSTVQMVGSGFLNPVGVAVDGNGNVFVADSTSSAVEEIVAVNGQVSSASLVKTVGSGFSVPIGVAVDDSGNIFVADRNNNAVKEIVAVNGQVSSSSTVNTVRSGFSSPIGVALDASGDVFVTDNGNKAVKEIVAVNGQVSYSSTVNTVRSGFLNPFGVAMDSSGNIFVTDASLVEEMALATPPSHVFPTTTPAGTTDTTDGTFSVTMANNGNSTLTFPLPSIGNNPSVSSNFFWANSSTCSQTGMNSSTVFTLVPGASCTVDIDFEPTTGGGINGSVTLIDDTLNAAAPDYATQSITLSGTGFGILPVNTKLPQGAVGVPYSQVLTAVGGMTPYTFSSTSTLPVGLSLSSNGTFSGTPQSGADGNYSITVTATDSSSPTISVSQTYSLTVNAAVIATVTIPAESLTYGTAASFTPVTGAGGTGTLTYSLSSALPAGLTFNTSTGAISGLPTALSSAAPYTVTVTDQNNVTASASFILAVSPATLTVTANNATKVYGTANPAFTGTVTGQQNGDVFTESFASTAALLSPAGSYVIVPSVTGVNASDYAQSITDGTLTITQAGTTTTLSASTSSIAAGASVTLTAQVASATAGTPTGTVSFYDGTTLLSTAALTNGAASYLATLSAGSTHSLTATYSGDVNFTTSSSAAGALVAVAASGISLTETQIGGAGPVQTVVAGSAAVYTFVVAPRSGNIYPGDVTFSVTGLPTGATATFSPATIAADSGQQTLSMTVQTAAGTASYQAPSAERGIAPVVLAFLFLPLFGAGRMRRCGRNMGRLICLLLFGGVAMTSMLTGCGSGSTLTSKTYPLTITATSGPAQQTITVTLYVREASN